MSNLSSTVGQTEYTVAVCKNAIAAFKVTENESKTDGNTIFENKEAEVEEGISSGERGETKMIVEKKVEEDEQVDSERESQYVCKKQISAKFIVSPEASLSKNSLKFVKLTKQVDSDIQKGSSSKTRIENVLVKESSLGTSSQTQILGSNRTKSVIMEERKIETISVEKDEVNKAQKSTLEEKTVDSVDKPKRQSKSIKQYGKPHFEEPKDSSLFSSNGLHFVKRTTTRRASTGSYMSECEMNSLIKVNKACNPR